MRAVTCRVDRASVTVDNRVVGRVEKGLLVYVGVMTGDTSEDSRWVADKLAALRIFNDEAGKMNLSVRYVAGGLLLIPNFTLAGRTKKGTRPSFSDAAGPESAQPLFNELASLCRNLVPTQTGLFGAHMLIDSLSNGPVTLTLDSRRDQLTPTESHLDSPGQRPG